MKVNLKELIEVLEKVNPALGTGGLVPEYKCFHFHGNEVWATDGTLTISCNSGPKTGLKCAVLGAPFLHLLRSLSESVEEVNLVYKDNEIKVKTNKVKGVFTTLSSVDIKKNVASDKDIVISKTCVERMCSDFVKGLSLCRFSVSKDETLGPLCGVMISRNTLLSSDRYRIAMYELKEKFPSKISLPSKFISVMIKNKDGIEEMNHIPEDRFTIILTDGTRISTSILVGGHPFLLKYFPVEVLTPSQCKQVQKYFKENPDKSEELLSGSSCKKVTLVDNLADVLERHISFLGSVDPVDKEILIKVGKNKCTLTSTDKELGELTEEVEVRTEEDSEIEFSINPVFLKEIVRLCDGFKYFTEYKIVLFEADSLRYLVQTRE